MSGKGARCSGTYLSEESTFLDRRRIDTVLQRARLGLKYARAGRPAGRENARQVGRAAAAPYARRLSLSLGERTWPRFRLALAAQLIHTAGSLS